MKGQTGTPMTTHRIPKKYRNRGIYIGSRPAKYWGRCSRCGEEYPAGTKIIVDRRNGDSFHASCRKKKPSMA